jgi:hypothetical protein
MILVHIINIVIFRGIKFNAEVTVRRIRRLKTVRAVTGECSGEIMRDENEEKTVSDIGGNGEGKFDRE